MPEQVPGMRPKMRKSLAIIAQLETPYEGGAVLYHTPLTGSGGMDGRASGLGVVLLEQVFGDVISRIEFQCFIQYPVNLGVISRLGHFRQPCV